jgi:hypothetical protein
MHVRLLGTAAGGGFPQWNYGRDTLSLLAAAIERADNGHVRHVCAQSLASVAGRLDAAEDARVCRQAARALIAAFGRETNVGTRSFLAEDVVSLVGRLDKVEAAQICGQAAQVLADAFAREMDADARFVLASALAKVSARVDPTEATRIRSPAARVLAGAIQRELSSSARNSLAQGLVWLAGLMDQSEDSSDFVPVGQKLLFNRWMDVFEVSNALVEALTREPSANLRNGLASLAGRSDPAGATRIYGQAALVLAAALENEKDIRERYTLAVGLRSLAGRFDPADAPRICGQAARSLANTLARETDDGTRVEMVAGLKSMAARIAPAEAARVLAAALKHGSNPSGLADLARILSATVDRLDDAEANRVCDQLIGSLDRDSFNTIAPELLPQLAAGRARTLAWDLASRMCSEPGIDTDPLSRILTDTSREQRARRAARVALAGPGPQGMLEAAMSIAAEPFPCRLTTQELVELLKMPTCYGGARRVVLDHLGHRYGRRFVNHWAFVRFAREQNLGLDFASPPRRPDPKGSVKPLQERLGEPSPGR